MSNNPYNTLDVDENATDSEIKQAFRDKSKINHPDKGGDEEKFKKVINAYAILRDPIKRKRFDETGDTNTEDPLANIMADLSQMFFEVVQRSDNKIEYLDIVKEMLKILSNAISLANNGKTDKDREIAKTKTLLNRITKKDDSENFFEAIIKGKIKQCKFEKEMIQTQIEKLEKMMEIIDLYECSSKEEEQTDYRRGVRGNTPTWFLNR